MYNELRERYLIGTLSFSHNSQTYDHVREGINERVPKKVSLLTCSSQAIYRSWREVFSNCSLRQIENIVESGSKKILIFPETYGVLIGTGKYSVTNLGYLEKFPQIGSVKAVYAEEEGDFDHNGVADVVKVRTNSYGEALSILYKLTEKGKAQLYGSLEGIEVYFLFSPIYPDNYDSVVAKLHLIHLALNEIGVDSRFSLKKMMWLKRDDEQSRFISTIINEYQAKSRELSNEINSLQSKLSQAYRAIFPINDMLQNGNGIKEKIFESIQKARKIGGVKDCYLDKDGKFILDTEHIYIPQDEEGYFWDIGKLTFIVEKTGTTKCENHTRYVEAYGGYSASHPHSITAEHELCLGDISSVVFDLMQRHDYTSLAGILINFGRSVNLNDSAGQYVTKWPTVQL